MTALEDVDGPKHLQMQVPPLPSSTMTRERAMELMDGIDRWLYARGQFHGTALKFPLYHRFTPGLYSREVHMPMGALLTSKIYKQTHQFVILIGKVAVWTYEQGWVYYEAPQLGITYAGTRRLLRCDENTVWATFHATDKTTIAAAEAEIYENPTSLKLEPGHSEVSVLLP